MTNCYQLKLQAQDGKYRQTDVTDIEGIKHVDENEFEYWYARELMQVLGYSSWDKFKNILKKAMMACENSEIPVEQCFS